MREVKPLTNVNGTPIVTFDEQKELGQDIIRDKVDLGLRKTNPDGSVARSLYHNAAVNKGWFYDNRFRVVGDRMQVVTAQTSDGFRAIDTMRSGRLYAPHILAYQFRREGKTIVLDATVMVSDDEFLADFTHKLDEDAMNEVLRVLSENTSGTKSVPESKLPI